MILVDSDVLITHLRGNPSARDWLTSARRSGPLAVSAVTVAEVTGGMRTSADAGERPEVRRLLASLDCEPVTREVAEQAGDLSRRFRRSHQGISTSDYLIAATAVIRDLQLATLNVRHFPIFPELSAPFSLDA